MTAPPVILARGPWPLERIEVRWRREAYEPAAVAASPAAYRDYIRRSDAELMVAKGMYVDSRSGWISERSLCYLAGAGEVSLRKRCRCREA